MRHQEPEPQGEGLSLKRSSDARSRLSKLAFLLIPGLFVAFCALLVSLWYVGTLSGWLIVSFAALIQVMLAATYFLALTVVGGRSRSREEMIGHCGVRQPEWLPMKWESSQPVGFDRVETVDCVFRPGQSGGFKVRCYNTNCPRFQFPDANEH